MEQDDNSSILNNINKLEQKVKELKKEKENIQHSCVHKDGFDINFDENKSIKKYCSTCKLELGYASVKEQDDFLKPKGK